MRAKKKSVLRKRQFAAHLFFTALLSVLLCSATFCLAAAQDDAYYPAEPVLRLESGMHTAKVTRIDVDREERFLVSASDDKTARI